MSGRRQTDLCKSGKKATVNDPMYRSVNRNAKAGSPEDIYRHNPWRAPGSAPIVDPCGVGEAGGVTGRTSGAGSLTSQTAGSRPR